MLILFTFSARRRCEVAYAQSNGKRALNVHGSPENMGSHERTSLMPFKHSLDPLFKPTSVAVVGASATAGSVGSILMRNLLENPFGGVVYPINPKRRSVHGVLCYPSLTALPEAVDLAVIATPAATVPATIRQCVQRGIAAAIIISAGFSELGADGRALERRNPRRRPRQDAHRRAELPRHPPAVSGLNASFAASMARPGRVALLSQSGAICTAVLDWARERQIGFSASSASAPCSTSISPT